MADSIYLYYKEKNTTTTFAGFSRQDDLDKHELHRRNFFIRNLYLPPRIFKGANLVEFGPGTGENSLVFASWGADLTLVEPNPDPWPTIQAYFKKFRLEDRLKHLAKDDLENFKTSEKFQFIDAEGFISTIKPDSIWINLFRRIIDDDGLFLISYVETHGSFLDLILKLTYARLRGILEGDSKDIALRFFQTKWDSIPHSRTFDSWFLDIPDNPFLKLKYFFNASTLCEELLKAGFSLYSSWPNYGDSLNIYWHKRKIEPVQLLENNYKFIERSCLSFAFGKKLFICAKDEAVVKKINDTLMSLLVLIDKAIDRFDSAVLGECGNHLNTIKNFLEDEVFLSNSERDKEEALRLIDSISKIFNMLIIKDITGLEKLCNSDSVFIDSWGQPCHFAVFRKEKG